MATPFERERAVAEAAVLRAAILTKRVQSSHLHAVSKADATPVTVADFAAQALLIGALHAAFPDDRFLGEEDSSALRRDPALRDAVYAALVSSSSPSPSPSPDIPASVDAMLDLIDLGGTGTGGPTGRFWVMDPIDGTATFLQGQQYAVALALIEHGREVVGVVAYPSLDPDAAGGGIHDHVVDAPDGLGVLLTAVKGRGATIRRFPSLAAASLATSPATPLPPLPSPPTALRFVDCQRSRSTDHAPVRALAARRGAAYPGLDLWASHVRYAALVLGAADAWVRVPRSSEAVFCAWDNAGAQLLFTERGGRVTDLDGRPVDFGAGRALSANRGMVAARAEVHPELLAAVAEVLAAEDDKEAPGPGGR